MDNITGSVQVLQNQLDIINNEISQCSDDDFERWVELQKIKRKLDNAILETMKNQVPMSDLSSAGPTKIGAGLCGVLFFLPSFFIIFPIS